MEQSTINIIIASISALATIAAAFIYYWTLNELKKQRENTARPHLFIDKIHFNVQGFSKGKYLMPLKWTTEKTNSVILEYVNKNEVAEFHLKCYNIGFGTATKVNIEFSYEIDDFISIIKELEKEIPKKDRIKIEKNESFISFSNENKEMPNRTFGLSIEHHLKHYITYILPINIKNEPVGVKLPSHYLELLNTFVYYSMTNPNDDNLDFTMPAITAKIEYSDINMKSTKEAFTIVARLSTMSLAGYSGTFELHKMK